MLILTQDTNPKPVKFPPKLPPELWYLIFIFATFGESRAFPLGVNVQHRLVTKRSLVLVCKSWHAIAVPLLYEVVWIRETSIARPFLRTLIKTAATDADTPAGHGKWVRCLILHQETGSHDWEDFRVADLLNRCPQVRVLLKLGTANADFWHGIAYTASCLACSTLGSFPSIRCIVWACSREPETVPIDALRLSTLLRHTPNLTVLYVLDQGKSPFSIRLPSSHPLTKLTNLMYLATSLPVPPLCLRQADMPNLACITAGLAALSARDPIDGNEDRSSLLFVFGKQLKVVDLVNSVPSVNGGGIIHDIRSIFRRCPNLRTFRFNVCPTVLPPDNGMLHPALCVIVLRITASQAVNDDELERSLRAQIKTIMGRAFPALRQVKLDVVGRSA